MNRFRFAELLVELDSYSISVNSKCTHERVNKTTSLSTSVVFLKVFDYIHSKNRIGVHWELFTDYTSHPHS